MKVAQAAMCRSFESCQPCAYWRVMAFCRVRVFRLCAYLFAYLVASVALLLLFLPLFIAVSQQPKGSFMYVILLSEAVN